MSGLTGPGWSEAEGSLDLDHEFERGVRCLLDLGYHKALGQEKAAYADALPRPSWDGEAAAEGYDRLILVDPRVPMEVALKHGNLAHHMPHAQIEDVTPARSGGGPYWLQAQPGDRFRGRAVRDAIAAFAPGERGLTVTEGIALVLQHPDVTAEDRGVDLPGSRARGFDVPCMAVWYGKVGLFGRSETIASPLYGAATARLPPLPSSPMRA
ncbi:MAG: DUF5701 family protein [Gemmatimonadales bacterium]